MQQPTSKQMQRYSQLHRQQQQHQALLSALLLLLATAVVQSGVVAAAADDQQQQQCRACDRIAAAFQRGLERTARDNFGGGNTNWEETRLGTYALSETRLVDITEGLCKKDSEAAASSSGAVSCHAMLERIEEDIERWWFGPFKANPAEADLREYVCVNRTGVCCGHGRWGPDCAPCAGCSGHGDCNGNGTRTGTGVCDCFAGYVGPSCADCAVRHYRAPQGGGDSDGDCLACHAGCRTTCTGPLATECDACADGYTADGAGGGCADVNECADEGAAAAACPGAGRYCENTPGSYRCRDCDPACSAASGCTGPGPAGCRDCAAGYEPATSGGGGGCQDVNECSPDSPHCSGQHERCVNTPGSYRCECQPGYQRQGGRCLAKKQPAGASAGKKSKSGKAKSADGSKKGKPPKLIWTVAYTLEFAKFFGALLGLGLFAAAVKGRPVPVVLAAGLAGWYLCHQSSVLDRVYLQARS